MSEPVEMTSKQLLSDVRFCSNIYGITAVQANRLMAHIEVQTERIEELEADACPNEEPEDTPTDEELPAGWEKRVDWEDELEMLRLNSPGMSTQLLYFLGLIVGVEEPDMVPVDEEPETSVALGVKSKTTISAHALLCAEVQKRVSWWARNTTDTRDAKIAELWQKIATTRECMDELVRQLDQAKSDVQRLQRCASDRTRQRDEARAEIEALAQVANSRNHWKKRCEEAEAANEHVKAGAEKWRLVLGMGLQTRLTKGCIGRYWSERQCGETWISVSPQVAMLDPAEALRAIQKDESE